MAKFLGVTADPTFVDQIVGKSSFDHMRKTKGGNETFEGNEPSSPVMYRKGTPVQATQPTIIKTMA